MTSIELRFSRPTNYVDSKLHILLYLAHRDKQTGGQSIPVSPGKCISPCNLHANGQPHRGGGKQDLTQPFRA